MNNKILNILFLAISVLLASCSEALQEGTDTPAGNAQRVAVNITAMPLQTGTPESRATIDDSTIDEGATAGISDFWLVEYDAGGTQIGEAHYLTWEDYQNTKTLPVILPEEAGTEYTCVVIANTHDANAASTMNFADLKQLTKKVLSQTDMYNNLSADSKTSDMLFNGVFKVTNTTTTADCRLYRNVAKLKLTLKNAKGSGIRLRTVQLKQVPNTLCYADQAVLSDDADYTENLFPATDDTEFIDLDGDKLGSDGMGLAAGDDAVTLTYYLPRNMRGTSTATQAADRNTSAPYKATYIELLATKVDAEGNELTPLRYRFYIGGNDTDDFNVKANHLYEMPITFTSAGNAETDSRVEDMGHCTLSADANTFMISPLSINVQQVYELPISRVNAFWDNTVFSSQLPEFEGTIKDETEWEACVLWQDQAQQMIQFCDENGKVTTATQGLYSATGQKNIFFKPMKGARGNVLVGIKKKGDDRCLWSWHLWITGYDPYTELKQLNDNEIDVPGGRILRYDDAEGHTWWASYPDTRIMDRNIGAAIDDTTMMTKRPTYGVLYQFNRKDPFPQGDTQVYTMDAKGLVTALAKKEYTVNGETTESYFTVKQGRALVAETVQHPTTLYEPTDGDWVKDMPAAYKNSNWQEMFDPSPAGWKVPTKGYTDIFDNQDELDLLTWQKGYYLYVDAAHTITTWYAATGSYNIGSGKFWNEGLSFSQWTATRKSETTAFGAMYLYSGIVNSNFTNTCARSFTIRCVKK